MEVVYPTGSVLVNASVDIPNGWTACNGALLDGTLDVYRNLFALIGTTYGGTGTSFAVPNLGGRVIAGLKSVTTSGLDGPIGSWIGASTVTPSFSQLSHAAHSHTLVDPGHTHTTSSSNTQPHSHKVAVYDYGVGVIKNSNTTHYGWAASGTAYNTATASVGVSFNNATPTVSVSSIFVAPAAHNNRQPVVASNYIIKL